MSYLGAHKKKRETISMNGGDKMGKKSKNKNELVSLISKLDLLEAVSYEILKAAPAYAKRQGFQEFAKVASEYIKDERQVLLIAVKIR